MGEELLADIETNTDSGAPEALPTAPKNITEQIWDAMDRGDKAEAQRLANVRAGIGDGPAPLKAGETMPPVSEDIVDKQRAAIEAQGPTGQALISEWGPDLAENLAYAAHAAQALSPEALAHFTTAVEREDGSTYVPGDDPAIMKLAAQVGRLFAHRDGSEVQPIPGQSNVSSKVSFAEMNERSRSIGKGGGSEAERERLTKAIHNALDRGDREPPSRRGGR
jgi:hypothetical protein